ncbi:MAG: ROK family protein [Limnochordales bacterium]|nr:ROK family protein [Limnochordales bacterium]
MGSAIGAGLILDGQLYYGANETAGEIGHIRVTEDGPQCSCGNYGCLEAVASGRAIARKAARLLKQGYPFAHLPHLIDSPDNVTAADVARAAAAGDVEALRIIHEAARYIGIAVSFLVNTLNPERIVIGGGVSRAGEMLLGPIRETVLTHAMPVARNRVQIVAGRLGSDAGPLGAAALVMDRLFPSIRLAKSELLNCWPRR